MSSKTIEINESLAIDFSLDISIKELTIWGTVNHLDEIVKNSVEQFKEEIKKDLIHKLTQETEFETLGLDRITFEINLGKNS